VSERIVELGDPQPQTKEVNIFRGDPASLGADKLPGIIRPPGLSNERQKYLQKEVRQFIVNDDVRNQIYPE